MPDTQPEEKYNPEDLKQIRTYQGDVAEALGRQNESLISIQQAEALKRREAGESLPSQNESRRKDFLYLFIGSAFFIIVGAIGAWYGYKEVVRRSAPPLITKPETELVTPNSEVILDITGKNREAFASSMNTLTADLGEAELKHVDVRNGASSLASSTPTAQFLNILEVRAPGSLVRAFSPIFMLGGLGEEQFIIIRLSSFENAFAGMLSWEGDMAEDLIPIFANANSLQANGEGNVFKDVIVKNKDVRVLEAAGEPVLLYTFFDNNMLIIGESYKTLEILMERLTREKLSR